MMRSDHCTKPQLRLRLITKGVIAIFFLGTQIFIWSCGDSNNEPDQKEKSNATAQTQTPSPSTAAEVATKKDPSKFWLETVKPYLEKNCGSCHNPALAGKANAGPMTIFSSTAMQSMLDNEVATETTLYKKITGQITHGGSNQCAILPELCTTVSSWQSAVLTAGLIVQAGTRSAASPNTNSAGGAGTPTYNGYGQVTSISGLGKILGFAVNPAEPESIIEYAVYIDGTNLTGKKLAQAPANAPGYDRDMPGDHRFEFQIPESYRNGKMRTLNIYSVVAGDYELINEGQTEFYGYVQTKAGKDYYTAEVQPLLLRNCQGSCHIGSMSYETNFGWLMTPPKHKGASATNNSHINNPAQANNESHGGNNRCNNDINSGVCQKLQEWWKLEFGNL